MNAGYLCMLLIIPVWIEARSGVRVGSQRESFVTEPGRMHEFPCPTAVKCRCDERTRTVSCRKDNLKSLPDGLSYKTRRLDLSDNNITHLTDGMFSNFTDLNELLLTNNRVRRIGKDVFGHKPRITYLNMGGNPIGGSGALSDLLSELRLSALQRLDISGISMNSSDQDSLKHSSLLFLRHLDLSNNPNVGNLHEDLFSSMKNLTYLKLESMRLFYLKPRVLAGLDNLQSLSLAKNSFFTFPFFFKGGQSVLPSLVDLDFSFNVLRSINPSSLKFPNLEKLRLTFNVLSQLEADNFAHLPALRELHLEHNRLWKVNRRAFNSSSLQIINMKDNKVKFNNRIRALFRYPIGLKRLTISRNAEMTLAFFTHAFQNLPNLEFLGMNSMHIPGNIQSIPKGAFSGLRNLKVLQYIHNSLEDLDRDVFQDLTSLQVLDLRSNLISVVNSTSLPLTLRNLWAVNLGGNPFHCDCNLLWFKSWINVTRVHLVFYHRGGYYKCKSPREQSRVHLSNFHPSPSRCLTVPMSFHLSMSIGTTVMFVVLVTMASGMYRWRWKLRYMVFQLSTWWRASQAMNQNGATTQVYKYDAFIGYNSEDSEWVNDVLLVELEQRSNPPFRLCVYERDWLPGYAIINCIGESIDGSRKTILIVTNSFAQSQWCQLELTLAQHRLFEEDQDNLILAFMEDIDPLNMTPRLALEMKRRTYLTWTEDVDGQQLFWEKLKKSLQEPLRGVSNCMPPIQEFCD